MASVRDAVLVTLLPSSRSDVRLTRLNVNKNPESFPRDGPSLNGAFIVKWRVVLVNNRWTEKP